MEVKRHARGGGLTRPGGQILPLCGDRRFHRIAEGGDDGQAMAEEYTAWC